MGSGLPWRWSYPEYELPRRGRQRSFLQLHACKYSQLSESEHHRSVQLSIQMLRWLPQSEPDSTSPLRWYVPVPQPDVHDAQRDLHGSGELDLLQMCNNSQSCRGFSGFGACNFATR